MANDWFLLQFVPLPVHDPEKMKLIEEESRQKE